MILMKKINILYKKFIQSKKYNKVKMMILIDNKI